ncbi:MAG: UDP-3-O-[Alphaproteobacteria bacterium]|nr:UDP-3-O-[3-hydroxymyristoyl] N-acetylglucosamine deacetylase [Alphaproteobacteria bacterium]
MQQKTLSKEVEINGIGLHSGCASKLKFKPAPANSGIVFVRSDLSENNRFPALYSAVVDTRNCTCLGNGLGQVVSTIEHIMATLAVLGIDNVEIEVNNPEVPIMDGSAKVFYEALKKVPLVEQNAPKKVLKIKKQVEFKDDKGNYVLLKPAETFKIHFTIDFPSAIVGHQEFDGKITENAFAAEIAPARTFCEKYQVDYLKSVGLIKGGSLDNAVVLDGDKILNEGGFRVKNECVNHKTLDCIGDMLTSGYYVIGEAEAFHSGHFHNNEVLKKLFENVENYEITEG